MGCYAPRHGWRSKGLTANGKRRVVFNAHDGYSDMRITIPCGSCLGCRTNLAQSWAVRASHEAKMHDNNAFITLTYDEKFLPYAVHGMFKYPTLNPSDFVTFIEKLRKKRIRQWRKSDRLLPKPDIKYLQSGEYGKLGRPHHHALLFGTHFPDMKRFKKRGEHWLFTSAELQELWPFGFSSIGFVTTASAKYVALYTVKKLITSTIMAPGVKKPYLTCSKGIGKEWLLQRGGDIYPSDEVVSIGDKHPCKPPRYYDKLLQQHHREGYDRIKARRMAAIIDKPVDERQLANRNYIHAQKLKQQEIP